MFDEVQRLTQRLNFMLHAAKSDEVQDMDAIFNDFVAWFKYLTMLKNMYYHVVS